MSIEVDGNVVVAEALLERVRALVQTIEARHAAPPLPTVPRESHQAPLEGALASMQPFLSSMRSVQAGIVPPQLPRPRGVRQRITVLLKRVVRRLTFWYIEPRWILQAQHDALSTDLAAALLAGVRQVNSDLTQVGELAIEIKELREQVARLRLQLVGSVERFNRHRRDVDALVREMVDSPEVARVREQTGSFDAGPTGESRIDYVAFEDRCRGSSADLSQAQRRYLSLFPSPADGQPVVDIGCGRGEMLELLISAGHEVIGVDTDPGMVDLCRAKGLPVVQDDALHFLAQTAGNSLRGIFCAQVVEHLTTTELEQLLSLAREKLVPGGVLVVETINPRSSFAIGNHFFADVTHVKPVHPETLRFLIEQMRFSRVKLEERSPHPAMALADRLPEDEVGSALRALLASVFGYQDYVIVATK